MAANHHRDPVYRVAVKSFGVAARYLQRQNFAKAKEIFEKLAATAPAELAERARLHTMICQQRLRRPSSMAKGTDYYGLGVAELNRRNIETAIEHLSKADKLEPRREHIQYALAAAHALGGNVELALKHLKAAITLRPENSFQARRDEDFAALAADGRFHSLVHPEVPPSSRVYYST